MTSPLDFTGLDSTSLENAYKSRQNNLCHSHNVLFASCCLIKVNSAWYASSSELFFVPMTKESWVHKPNAPSDDFRCGSSCWVSISEARRRGISLGLGMLTVGANGFEGSARLIFIPSKKKNNQDRAVHQQICKGTNAQSAGISNTRWVKLRRAQIPSAPLTGT